MMAMRRCPKCGLRQDPEHPLCVHFLAAKAGRKAQQTLKERYGPGVQQSAAGRAGAAARWKRYDAQRAAKK